MLHLKTLAIKFIVASIVVLSFFTIFNDAVFNNLVLISFLTTIITYLIGDLVILRRFGNVAASIADFGLAFLLYWSMSSFFLGASAAITLTSLAAAFFTTVPEPFIHEYIRSQKYSTDKDLDFETVSQLQTEFGEEGDIKARIKKEEQEKKQNDDGGTN